MTPVHKQKPIKIALASFGMSGMVFHAPLIDTNPNYKLVKILERSRDNAKELYPHVKSVKSYDNVLLDPEVEVIVVNTPDIHHYPMAKKALEAGKHVIVEKPFVLESVHGEELIKLAKSKNLLLTVFHNRRWDADFLTVTKIIQKKMVGNLKEYIANFERYRPTVSPKTNWKDSAESHSGTIYNLGAHSIDQALVLFGMPKWLFANVRCVRENAETDDAYDIFLGYDDVKVHLRSSYLAKEESPRFLLHGTHGSFMKYGMDSQEDDLKEGLTPIEGAWGKDMMELYGTLNSTINEMEFAGDITSEDGNYPYFYENFYQTLRNGGELAVKPTEANNVIRIIEAAMKSSNEKIVIKF